MDITLSKGQSHFALVSLNCIINFPRYYLELFEPHKPSSEFVQEIWRISDIENAFLSTMLITSDTWFQLPDLHFRRIQSVSYAY